MYFFHTTKTPKVIAMHFERLGGKGSLLVPPTYLGRTIVAMQVETPQTVNLGALATAKFRLPASVLMSRMQLPEFTDEGRIQDDFLHALVGQEPYPDLESLGQQGARAWHDLLGDAAPLSVFTGYSRDEGQHIIASPDEVIAIDAITQVVQGMLPQESPVWDGGQRGASPYL